jgi:hypothetical protein
MERGKRKGERRGERKNGERKEEGGEDGTKGRVDEMRDSEGRRQSCGVKSLEDALKV